MMLPFAPCERELEIVRINADENTNRRLVSMGLAVGSRVTLLDASGGNCIISCRQCRVAINKALAMKIVVN